MTDHHAVRAIRLIALAGALGAGCALAQTKPPVVDVGPPPAESRDSAGAIVLDNAPVRAQREAVADPAAATRTMGNVGAADQAVKTRQMRDELARQREAEARELRLRGAAGLTSN